MKTLTTAQLDNLLESKDWVHASDTGEFDNNEGLVFGWGAVVSTIDDIFINYKESWQYTQQDQYSFDHGCSDSDDGYTANFILVDEEGDSVNLNQYICDQLDSKNTGFDTVDYDSITGEIVQTEEIAEDQQITEINGEKVEEHIALNDNERNYKFIGVQIAKACSRDPYNDKGRWTNIEVYKTVGGKYIVCVIGVTCWQGEKDRHQATVCDNFEEIKDLLGDGWLAEEIYEKLGIDNALYVD